MIAIAGDDTLHESGEMGSMGEIVKTLPTLKPTLFVKQAAADFVGHLNTVYLLKSPTSWQWRVSVHEREICRPDGVKVASRMSTVIQYFGFKGGNYHRIIDPVTMYGHRLDVIWPGEDDPLVRLLQWGVTVRDFCDENGLAVRPTTGSIGSQFLTDRRFYPQARRKVPAATNETIREQLPGNHYYLNVYPSSHHHHTAYYLDQHRAHHYHARTVPLPDADTLYAFGRFRDLKAIVFPYTIPGFHGLYCLDLQPPARRPPFTWLTNRQGVFVYSNELPHLLDSGYTVTGVRAAWGSLHRDRGISQYATWAESQLDRFNDAPWLKSLLLSTYGTLATRPKQAEAIFRLAKKGDPVTIKTGHRQLDGRLTKGAKKLEPRIANVIHRGMIEAATRSESVGLAQWLDHQGHTILSIYADAVIVENDDDKPLPSIPEPWRYKKELNHLQFINQQAFTSDGMTKLPGVGRELREYRQHRTPGYAPRKVAYEALTEKKIVTDRRI